MNKEQLRMSFLAGLITEGEYKQKLEETIYDRDILSRPLSNPDIKYKEDDPEMAARHLDARSESILRSKYRKEINNPSISDEDLRYILGGSGEKGMGGRPNSIDNIIKNRNVGNQDLNENVVGIGAINNPFPTREKSDYELAFEHFTKGEVNEEMESEVGQRINTESGKVVVDAVLTRNEEGDMISFSDASGMIYTLNDDATWEMM